ncbi:hypothetical protein LIS77_23385 [Cytobacillus firmus]|uniref:hypothetical protein n=1 Tax=Cytobacillus firmus TaxID=1399 RepID=UPI00207ACECC|nr:hypothetical protein [Cytobacillus firmus]USK38790.1 hypothetical protein LIS77_23385 [Cytobacillus firmus]
MRVADGMRIQDKDFTPQLKTKIEDIEQKLKEQAERLQKEHRTAFSKKGLKLEVAFDQEGNDVFQPGYSSSISVGFTDKNGDLIDLKIIKIWECERIFLGMPVLREFPGSKVAGELLDESPEEISIELKEYMDEILTEETK